MHTLSYTRPHACTRMHIYRLHLYIVCFNRFLEQITVYDKRSEKNWTFVCDRRLVAKENRSTVSYRLRVTKEQKVTYTLRVKLWQGLRDQHRWTSIFTFDRHSNFTRVQRLSCCFAYLLSTMVVNIIFYEKRSKNSLLEKLRFYEIDTEDVIIGTQSALISFPINMLIIYIFRYVTPRNMARQPYYFPWWGIFIAWTLIFVKCLVSSYVTIMYGLSYGYDKSMAWLRSFLLSSTTDISIFQPVKVVIFVCIYTLILKHPVQPINNLAGSVGQYYYFGAFSITFRV